MHKMVINITALILSMNIFLPLNAMFTQISRRASQSSRLTRPTTTTIQKRTYYNPHKFKGLPPLTEQAQFASPLRGAVEWESGRLPRMYTLSAIDDPFVELVHELYHQIKSDFGPTRNLSKAAYSLNPGIIGLVIGALISNKLHDEKEREYIIAEWRKEYARLTKEKKPFSKTKINNLLDLIQKAYNANKNEASAILVSFLYAKANPETDHDILHYLLGLNHYIDVFIKKKSYIAQTFQKATQIKDKTLFEKLASLLEWFNKPILQSYTQREYNYTMSTLDDPRIKKDSSNFNRIIGALINEKQKESPYPLLAILNFYGYKGQQPVVDCFEMAFQNWLNILIYDQSSQTFNLSLLPTTIHINEDLKNFYDKFPNTTTINTTSRGQAFMDLVSGLSEQKNGVKIVYVEKNYEIETGTDTENNILELMNYFFHLNANNFEELGIMLSDERRTVQFTREKNNHLGDSSITMRIKKKSATEEITASFGFNLEHAWITIPGQSNAKDFMKLLPKTNIGKEYEINPYVKALFDIQPSMKLIENIDQQVPISMYYSLPTDLPSQKIQIITTLLKQKNVDKKALDYACSLYKQLSQEDRTPLILETLIEKIITSEDWLAFKEFLADNLETTLQEITMLANTGDQKYIDQLAKWQKYKETKNYNDLVPEQPFTETKEHLVTE